MNWDEHKRLHCTISICHEMSLQLLFYIYIYIQFYSWPEVCIEKNLCGRNTTSILLYTNWISWRTVDHWNCISRELLSSRKIYLIKGHLSDDIVELEWIYQWPKTKKRPKLKIFHAHLASTITNRSIQYIINTRITAWKASWK